MGETIRPPVHESLTVLETADIYRTSEWWKAVVRYQFEGSGDYSETATYLWHNDDNWTRKNKYVIKTADAWNTDTSVVDSLLNGRLTKKPEYYRELPVSDYYTVGAGETIFRSNGWWKAILRIDEKGSYETEEVMIYLWQQTEDGWRRRQKHTIKNESDWEEERSTVDQILGNSDTDVPETSEGETNQGDNTTRRGKSSDELEKLHRELEDHVSGRDLN
jgi:hypothetical protein